ncbi:hypothetical protein ACFL9U_13910 [Thermodesulfobacteriota bacterium]
MPTDHYKAEYKSLPDKLKGIYEKCFMHIRSYVSYGQKIIDVITRAFLLILFTAPFYFVLLYVSKTMWSFYTETYIGQKFLIEFPMKSRIIIDAFSRISFIFAAQLTVAAFLICLAAAAVCQVFYVARYLYYPRGFFGKIFMWGLPLTALVAFYYKRTLGFQTWPIPYLLALIPTLCVFVACFKFSDELLPEIGDVIRKIITLAKKQIKQLYEKISAS